MQSIETCYEEKLIYYLKKEKLKSMFYCTTSPRTITQRYKIYNIVFHFEHRSSFSMYHRNAGCSPSGVLCQSTREYHICFSESLRLHHTLFKINGGLLLETINR